ncbi:hypothetical protein V6N13_042799 [Hibiscus sabdariffa]|uniref:Uncharacterized protein n=2 Tax=Hibiscus sabdariffa TaxID=183260 RepID=A0ABR2G3J3_9ROSI
MVHGFHGWARFTRLPNKALILLIRPNTLTWDPNQAGGETLGFPDCPQRWRQQHMRDQGRADDGNDDSENMPKENARERYTSKAYPNAKTDELRRGKWRSRCSTRLTNE